MPAVTSVLDADAPVVAITGASSGIGRATAHQLARRGTRLVLAARRIGPLDQVAEECRALGGQAVITTLDVGNQRSGEQLVRVALQSFGRLDACVHAAGVVAYGRFEDVPGDVFDEVVHADVLGTANVARAVLRHHHQVGTGTLVIVGSVLGHIVTPYLSPYVASKAAVEALGRTLAIEQQGSDVRVCVVSPGSVRTPIFRRAANYAGRYGRPPWPVISPERAARAVVKGIDHPKTHRNAGPANLLMVLGFHVFPRIFDRLVNPLMRVAGLSPDRVAPHPGNVLGTAPSARTGTDGEVLLPDGVARTSAR